jgi:hypothetical protein
MVKRPCKVDNKIAADFYGAYRMRRQWLGLFDVEQVFDPLSTAKIAVLITFIKCEIPPSPKCVT